jgi:hypothetical protein
MKALPWLAAGVFGGIMYYLVITGKFDASNGKFLGAIEETPDFGLDEVAKGLVIVGGAALIGKTVHSLVPAIPAGKVA